MNLASATAIVNLALFDYSSAVREFGRDKIHEAHKVLKKARKIKKETYGYRGVH